MPHCSSIYRGHMSELQEYLPERYGVQVHFKGGTTLKNLLVSPKDKDTITK